MATRLARISVVWRYAYCSAGRRGNRARARRVVRATRRRHRPPVRSGRGWRVGSSNHGCVARSAGT